MSGTVARCEQTLPRVMRGQCGRATYPNDFGARLGSLSDDLGRIIFSLVRLRFLALLVRDRGVVVLASWPTEQDEDEDATGESDGRYRSRRTTITDMLSVDPFQNAWSLSLMAAGE